MMRILLDENIQQPTVDFLRSLGLDVCTIKEEGLATIIDEAVFKYAQDTGRTLITYNADFTDLRDLAGKHHPGIIRLRISNQRAAYLHPILERAMQEIRDMALGDMLVTISDKRIRMRHTYAA